MRTNSIFRIYFANVNREILANKDQIKSANKESRGKITTFKATMQHKLLHLTRRKPII